MADLLQSVLNVVSAPFAQFFPRQNRYNNSPQNLNIGLNQPQPYQQPPRQLTPREEFVSLGYDAITAKGFHDSEIPGRLQMAREARAKESQKSQEKRNDEVKFNAAQQQIAQKDAQKNQDGWNTYNRIQADRENQSTMLRQRMDAEAAPLMQYYNQQAAYQNQGMPLIKIKFG